MLKSVLILLNEAPSSASALQYAIRLAQDTGAQIAGLAPIDLTSLEAPMIGGIGTSSINARLVEKLKKQADDARQHLHETFEAECRAHHVPFEWHSFEGDPIATVNLAAETHDLIITGYTASFRGNVNEKMTNMIAKQLLRIPRPAIICS